MDSILGQMENVYKRRKNGISTAKNLNNIYGKLTKQIKKKQKQYYQNRSLNDKAKKIEDFLKEIKKYQQYFQQLQLNPGEDPEEAIKNFFAESKYRLLFQALYNTNPHIFKLNLLNKIKENADQSVLSQKLGTYLEWGLTEILNTYQAAVSGREYSEVKESNKGVISIGGAHISGTKQLVDETNEIMRNKYNEMYQIIQKNLKEYNQKNTDKIAEYMPSVQGKIDINSFQSIIEIKDDLKLAPYTQEVLEALSGATFTAKNYISTSQLYFGQTNPFRVYVIVAAQQKDIIGHFCRMITCFENHQNISPDNESPTLFYRIRAIYELTGYGAHYINTELNNIFQGRGADFLVWNNPARIDEIRVIPTQAIIQDLIENAANEALPKNYKDALFGPISLSQTDLKNIKLTDN